MANFIETLKHNRIRISVLGIIALLFLLALPDLGTKDWSITVLRGLSVGAVTFLVAAGLSLILGLMDVLNLAHGEFFMLGAYVGWTVYVRPDTFVDVLPPLLLLAAGFVLLPVWKILLSRWRFFSLPVASGGLVAGIALLAVTLFRYPISIWNAEDYSQSPISYSLALSQNKLVLPPPVEISGVPPLVVLLGILLGGALVALWLAAFSRRNETAITAPDLPRTPLIFAATMVIIGLISFWLNGMLTDWLIGMSTTLRFFVAMVVASGVGFVLGGIIETTMIRPLYDRPIYQIMLTLGLSFIGIETVRAIWGRPEFTMPKPELFAQGAKPCPAHTLGDWLTNHCSTILLFDGRVRTYNEIFIIAFGVLVLVAIWLILQRTRLGMIIRAGVQDSEMVEALGINVRQVFTLVFAMGTGIAALGGILAAPSVGLSNDMGTRLLLLALIALAIGGLTSFPGAAVGSVLVGLLQQFIIKYGRIGIHLPFLDEPLKPSPPLVPASTILLMVIILLVLPQGLFGRNE